MGNRIVYSLHVHDEAEEQGYAQLEGRGGGPLQDAVISSTREEKGVKSKI